MTDPVFDTAVTRAFGCRLPIVAGGLMWLSDASYVAAGGYGQTVQALQRAG